MQVDVYSGDYKIIHSGQVFLAGTDADFRIKLVSEENVEYHIVISFERKKSQEQRIERIVKGKTIQLICTNFEDAGSGLAKPAHIARMEGKEIFFMFWSYVEGASKIRSVKYTIFGA